MLLTCMRNPARRVYAERSIRSVARKLRGTTPETVRWHIADDGSTPHDVEGLRKLIESEGFTCTTSETGGHSYGASYNLGTQALHPDCKYILPLEDDWELVEPVDLADLLQVFADPDVGCLRLGYLGYTQQLRGEVRRILHRLVLLFDPESPEPHVCAGHPRIERVEWAQRVGPWTEGIDPGATEYDWCMRPQAREGVAWLMDRRDVFAHIGTVQAREDQHHD
jgi:hypothetical protein